MSGPKRGSYYIWHDPTPRRLADLGRFCGQLDQWVERNGGFLRRHLGEEGLNEASQARSEVRQLLATGDPDQGFDAYGRAWATFNRLWSEAAAARDKRRLLQDQKQLEREAAHWQRIQEARAEADQEIEECRELWHDPGHQVLLSRWTPARIRQVLQASLESLTSANLEEVPAQAAHWQRRFQITLQSAADAAEDNARVLAELTPLIRQDLAQLAALNLEVLPEKQLKRMEEECAGLTEQVGLAVAEEDEGAVEEAHQRIQGFLTRTRPILQAAQLSFAGRKWQDALRQLGFAVRERQGIDGALVLEAEAFPLRRLEVQLAAGSDEVRLNVDPEHDTRQCHQDVQSLQKILRSAGIRLEMTDWGRAEPDAGVQLTTREKQQIRNKR